jgi:glycosyltransferase involved in cell wall biosynthesis
LRRALDSSLSQTYAHVEVIVADDCSPNPEVGRLLGAYAADPRVIYERPSRNVGVVANLLRAIQRSRGAYVSILCDDDELDERFVERLVEPLAREPSIAVAYCDSHIIDGAGKIALAGWGRRQDEKPSAGGVQQPFFRAALVDRRMQPAIGSMFRKSAIAWSDFPLEARGAWDLWLAYLACREGGAAWYLPETLFRYRVHAESLTVRGDVGTNLGAVFVLERLLRDVRLLRWKRTFRRRLAREQILIGLDFLCRQAGPDARPHFRAALRNSAYAKASIGLGLSYLPGGLLKVALKAYGALRA